jgi:hypothetical protein
MTGFHGSSPLLSTITAITQFATRICWRSGYQLFSYKPISHFLIVLHALSITIKCIPFGITGSWQTIQFKSGDSVNQINL